MNHHQVEANTAGNNLDMGWILVEMVFASPPEMAPHPVVAVSEKVLPYQVLPAQAIQARVLVYLPFSPPTSTLAAHHAHL